MEQRWACRTKSISSFNLYNAATQSFFDLPRGALFQDKSRRLNAELQYNNSVGKLFDVIVGGQFQQDVAQSNNTYLLDKGG